MNQRYLKGALALGLSCLLLTPSLVRAQAETGADELLQTAVPENNLSLETFRDGLKECDFESAAKPSPRLPLPKRRSFWSTTETCLFGASLVSFAGLNVADYYLTKEALKYPGATEMNPVLGPIVKNSTAFALFKLGYIALNTFGLSSIHRTDKPLAWVLTVATNVLSILAVSHNLDQLKKLRGE